MTTTTNNPALSSSDEALFSRAFRLGHSFALIATDGDGESYIACSASEKEILVRAAETSFRDSNPRIYEKAEDRIPHLIYPKG